MNTQIAIPIDKERKSVLLKNLKKQGLSTKAFIIFCIDAYNTGNLSLGILPQYDSDSFLSPEEKIKFSKVMKRFKNGEYDDLETVMRQRGIIK